MSRRAVLVGLLRGMALAFVLPIVEDLGDRDGQSGGTQVPRRSRGADRRHQHQRRGSHADDDKLRQPLQAPHLQQVTPRTSLRQLDENLTTPKTNFS